MRSLHWAGCAPMRGRVSEYRHSVADVGETSGAMREIVLASQGDAPSDGLLAHICSVVSRSFEFERVAVVRYHERLGEVAPVAVVGESPGPILPPLPIHEAPALGRALDAQQVVFVADAREEGALAERLV